MQNITDIDRQLSEAVQRRKMSRLIDNELAELILTERIDGLLDRRLESVGSDDA